MGDTGGNVAAIPIPRRIKACALYQTSLDLHSICAVNLFARHPREMIELCWTIPLRWVASMLFGERQLDVERASQILCALVQRVALTAQEASELAEALRVTRLEARPSSAAFLLERLGIPIDERGKVGWAIYANARAPAINSHILTPEQRP